MRRIDFPVTSMLAMHEYLVKPVYQAGLFMLLSVAAFPIARPKDADSAYAAMGAIYAAFILVNTIGVFFAPKVWHYFGYSMICSAGYLLVIALLVPVYLSISKTNGSSESAMVFLIILYHPVMLLLMIFSKWAYFKVVGVT